MRTALSALISTAALFAPSVVQAQLQAEPPAAELVEVTYHCERGVSLPAVYVNDGAGHVVALIEGQLLVLPRAISASGARYRAAEQPGYELWSKGDSATLSWGSDADSTILLRDCLAADAADAVISGSEE